MVKKWQITIPEFEDNSPRNLYIYLPLSYSSSHKRYPVLYMFDGHNLFFDSDATYGKSWGLKKYLDKNRVDLIVVAPECSHHPDNGRLKEYAPYTFTDTTFGQIEGHGRTTMEWMIHVLKKEIDQQFRTRRGREYTYIAGSSMGGLMSLYALIQYNQVFSRAAALSPSLWTAPDKLTALIRKSRLSPDTICYIDYGSEEFRNHPSMEAVYRQITNELEDRHILLTNRIVPGGKHCEASWEKQLPFVIPALLYKK